MVFPATNFSVSIGALECPPDSDTNGCAASFTVTKVIPHPQFNAENLDNDIGISIHFSKRLFRCTDQGVLYNDFFAHSTQIYSDMLQ